MVPRRCAAGWNAVPLAALLLALLPACEDREAKAREIRKQNDRRLRKQYDQRRQEYAREVKEHPERYATFQDGDPVTIQDSDHRPTLRGKHGTILHEKMPPRTGGGSLVYTGGRPRPPTPPRTRSYVVSVVGVSVVTVKAEHLRHREK